MKANLEVAVELCRTIEGFAPQYGCHVALTGGCLYKDGGRKDIDILFYRIRQEPFIDIEGLMCHLESVGFEIKPNGFGWIYKAVVSGIEIDMFFPEEQGGRCYKCGTEHEGDCPEPQEKLFANIANLIANTKRDIF